MKSVKKQKINKKITLFLRTGASVLLALFLMINLISANAQQEDNSAEVGELNKKIEDQRKEVEALQKKISEYNNQIKKIQGQGRSLGNQIAILENQIAKINLDVEATEKSIEQTKLEVQAINLQIIDLEFEIADQKSKIAEYLRLIYKNDQVSYLEILLMNNSFSEFFDYLKYAQGINGKLNDELAKLKVSIQNLETQKTAWEQKAEQEKVLKEKLVQQRSELEERISAQGILLAQNRLNENQYQATVRQLQLEQQQANADIAYLEKTVRQKLTEKQAQDKFESFGPARLAWPVSPSRGITAFFHDPTYPFRHLFEHPAIDIRAPQGTAIKAAESGYVAQVRFKGDSSYAYVMIIHNDGISTVYGHISSPHVKIDEYVTKGQVIASSGGAPGSVGSGLSTGPHLHFEVRLNGIPVNPLDYLPGY
jgi:murein DD-endopeptidase MepM/ murein hydrolase activator NlpD